MDKQGPEGVDAVEVAALVFEVSVLLAGPVPENSADTRAREDERDSIK